MESGDDRAAKRQKLEPQGYSAESDLDVEVAGEVFPVHGAILMITNPVFRQMLTHKMAEASSRRIDRR